MGGAERQRQFGAWRAGDLAAGSAVVVGAVVKLMSDRGMSWE